MKVRGHVPLPPSLYPVVKMHWGVFGHRSSVEQAYSGRLYIKLLGQGRFFFF